MNSAPCRLAFLLLPLVLTLACFAFSPQAQAVCQDGCLPNFNTVLGENALLNTTGGSNTAMGAFALNINTTGGGNTATGEGALEFNTTANDNTANGAFALSSNETGEENTATGFEALFTNSTGSFNTAYGSDALVSNDTGGSNTAVGKSALADNQTGSNNTAAGLGALSQNNGNENTAIGVSALGLNLVGINNTALGANALVNNISGSSNIALGESAGINLTTGSNNIDIANRGVAGESNTIRLGKKNVHTNTYIWGISGVVVPGGVGVIIGTNGHLGTVVSSSRFKDGIKPMDKASETILALKPVTFRYKKDLDPQGIPQFGLVAEQVEKVAPDLVARDADGKVYAVRYEAVNAMLLNEFLKARRQIDAQQKQIDALTAGLQKVSAQLELSKSAPQTALNNQ
jgi:hypothetical protein